MPSYYVRLDGETRGPFELSALAEAGVRPSTYVWCKGMPDWEKAEDVADICRMFRCRIHDLMHPESVDALRRQENAAESLPAQDAVEQYSNPSRYDRFLQQSDQPQLPSIDEIEERKDKSCRPANMLPWAILSLFFCPPLAVAAIYFSIHTNRLWKASLKETDEKTASELKNEAHEASRSSKMWTGISLCIGLIIWSAIIFK